ncbi:MAG: site-2 protease family protein [Planctomycetota bacterium]
MSLLRGKKKDIDAEGELKSGDIILAIGDVENPTYKEMRDVTTEYQDKELTLKVLRSDANEVEETTTVTVVPKRHPDVNKVLIGIAVALDAEHPVVAKTIATENSAALEIPRGAVITAVNETSVSSFYDVIREIRRNTGQRIIIDYHLDEEIKGNVVLDAGTSENQITVKSTFAEFVPFEPLVRLYKASGPIDAIWMGYKKTFTFIAHAYITLKRLIGGLISPKGLMGPVGIITLSYRIVAERPLIEYAYFLGLISAMLVVFNLIPLLPFDGGHILFLLVEKIKGSAVSERVQGTIAYAGWILVGALFLYVTFNDIIRSLFGISY